MSVLAAFGAQRTRPVLDYIYRLPLMPWICPPLHPELRRVLENIGERTELGVGEMIYREDQPVARFAVVERGMIARQLGAYNPGAEGQFALALPGNIATGNLNIFSGRPAAGSYRALQPSVVLSCPQEAFLSIVAKDPNLPRLLALQCELSGLSDRLSFACLTLLKKDECLKALLLGWNLNYGRLSDGRVEAPRILSRENISGVLGCSLGWLDRITAAWRRAGDLQPQGVTESLSLKLLNEANELLRSVEEPLSSMPRPADIRQYWG
jgi:CRP-like cAMP-binding protein